MMRRNRIDRIIDRTINEGLGNMIVNGLGGMPRDRKEDNESAIKFVCNRLKDTRKSLYDFSEAVNQRGGGMVSGAEVSKIVKQTCFDLQADIEHLLNMGLRLGGRSYNEASRGFDMNDRF